MSKTDADLIIGAASVIQQLVTRLQDTAGVAVDWDTEQALQNADHWLDDYEARCKVPERINGRCVWCGDPMEVPQREQGGGRTKRFCCSAHRIAHHRWKTDPYAPQPPIGSSLTRKEAR